MSKVLTRCIAVVLILILATPVTAYAGDTTAFLRSVARVEATVTHPDYGTGTGTCTAFSINRQMRYFLTAAHCVGTDITVNKQMATVVYIDVPTDLMVLSVPGLSLPALKMADRPPVLRQEVIAAGYGMGYATPMVKSGRVMLESLDVTIDHITARYMFTDYAFIGGMSGGPVVDTKGRLVGVVQRGNASVGLAAHLDTIRRDTASFWE